MDLTLYFTRGVSLRTWEQAGMLTREVALYRRLAEKGAGVRLVTYGGRGEAARVPGIEVLCNRWGLPGRLYEAFLPKLHGKALRGTSVVKSNQVAGADLALAAARRHGKPFVARCGYLPSEFARHADGDVAGAEALERRVFAGADRVVVTTGTMRDVVTGRYGLDTDKVLVVPNYVDTKAFSPRGGGDGRRICFIGRLVEQKNLFALLEALRGLEAELVVVGDGHLRASLEAEAERLGLAVDFRGNLPHERLPDVLADCGLFVLPSHYEGHPKVLLESMACGLPVLGAENAGIREVIRHRDNGLLCQPTAEGLHAALSELLEDSALRGTLGSEARRFVVETCSLDRVADMEYELLMELA